MTTDTPIQFPDDDHALLRQLFALVQNIDARLNDFKSSVNERLSSIDGRLAETNKLDKLNRGCVLRIKKLR